VNHASIHTGLDVPVGNSVDEVSPRSVLPGGVRAARTIVWGASAAVLVLAISSLIGGGGSPALLAPDMGMRPASAVVLALLAMALVCLGSGWRYPWLVRGGRLLAVTAVAATMLALLLHAGVGRRMAGAIAPGFLAQIDLLPTLKVAAGGMLGLALLCLHRDSPVAARLMVVLALASGLSGLLAVFGHVFDAPQLYFGSGATAVAPMGAVSVLMLSIGALCAEPDRGPVGLLIADDAGGASLRHLLPAVLVLLPALAWTRVTVERAGWVSTGASGALFSAFIMGLLGGLLAIDAGRLSRLDRRNRGAALGLAALAADLERQVSARTRELSHSNAELRQEVAERQSAEELFRVLFADAPSAVVIVDGEGLILLANTQAEALFGYTARELLGQPVEMLIPVDLQEAHRRYRQAYMAAPTRRPMGAGQVLSGRCKDGSQPILEISLSPAQLRDRQVFIASIQDITARRQLEQARSEARQRFQDLVTNVPLGVYRNTPGPEGRFLEVNPAFVEIIEADSVQQALATLAHTLYEDPAQRLHMSERLLEQGRLSGAEFSMRTLKGRPFWARLSAVRRQAADGSVYFDGVVEDITERRQAEQHILDLNRTLAERADELEVANRELEAFSYSVSHDLRAPLRAIDGFSRIIEQQCADRLDEANHERLVRVRHNAQRMGALIDDLLNLARLTRAPLQRRQVDLSAMAAELAASLRERDPDRHVEVRIAPGLRAWGDGPLLRVALDNLLDNGWKFTRNVAAACIELGLEPVDGESVFVIRDNGAGFDMAHAEQLFGPFQRLHGTDEFPGTGIGLATVQRIIHKHGGRIWAQAQPQQGATFRFTLPREAPP